MCQKMIRVQQRNTQRNKLGVARHRLVHEHPNSATSWLMPEAQALASMTGVMTTTCSMCAY